MVTLPEAKLILRISGDDFNSEISSLIDDGYADLATAGVIPPNSIIRSEAIKLVDRAVKTYVRLNFGQPDDFDKLKESYNMQKAQLATFTGATVWGED